MSDFTGPKKITSTHPFATMMSPFDDSQGNLRPDDESEEFDSVPPTPMLDVHRALLPPPASAAPERNTLLRFQLPPLALLLLLLKTLEPPSQ